MSATWDPASAAGVGLASSNLKAFKNTAAAAGMVRSTLFDTAGLIYFEGTVTCGSPAADSFGLGIANENSNFSNTGGPGSTNDGGNSLWVRSVSSGTAISLICASAAGGVAATIHNGDKLGIYYDIGSKKVYVSLNGTPLIGNPGSGTIGYSDIFNQVTGVLFAPGRRLYAMFGATVNGSTTTNNYLADFNAGGGGSYTQVGSGSGLVMAGAQRLLKPSGLIRAKAGGIPSDEYYAWMKDRKK